MGKWIFHRFLFLFACIFVLVGCGRMPVFKSEEPAKYVLAPHASESRFFYTRSGLRLFGQWWLPTDKPKAVVLLVHGTVLHSGFYDPWAYDLTQKGYAVFGIDLRGWGQSQGYGRRGGVGNYDEYVEDVELARREVRRRFNNRPVYLQGESLGGAVVLMSAMTGRVRTDGLILNAPAMQPNPAPMVGLPVPDRLMNFGIWSGAQFGRWFADWPALPILNMFIGRVMSDKDAQDRFKADPNATHSALPVSYIAAIEDAGKRLTLNVNNIHQPLIILHGTKDALVPKSSSELLFKTVQSTDKTFKVYQGMRHATLHDKDRQQVWSDIETWLDGHAATAMALYKDLPDEQQADSNPDQGIDQEKTAYRVDSPQLTMTTRNLE